MNETTALETAAIDQLKTAFTAETAVFLERAEQKLALARSLNDQEAMVKEHIKMQWMKEARGIFQACYLDVVARSENKPGASQVIFL